jgi:hypothetical protein
VLIVLVREEANETVLIQGMELVEARDKSCVGQSEEGGWIEKRKMETHKRVVQRGEYRGGYSRISKKNRHSKNQLHK